MRRQSGALLLLLTARPLECETAEHVIPFPQAFFRLSAKSTTDKALSKSCFSKAC